MIDLKIYIYIKLRIVILYVLHMKPLLKHIIDIICFNNGFIFKILDTR